MYTVQGIKSSTTMLNEFDEVVVRTAATAAIVGQHHRWGKRKKSVFIGSGERCCFCLSPFATCLPL